ncbi:hypothetical protein QJS04_geneDACA020609 [Acorus gramineus]|uniref:Sas10 C-terminal domain-containing protein n=1 Tax=Acorus gramineus TaxID=55184 RepID=A0AAV9B9S6_ACOGR|nr:hypothetical protein QJS04_geneDACA020609 [Acorus gramineus]
MGRGSKEPKKRGLKNPNKNPKTTFHGVLSQDMDDEIDAFHKQRDIIPLDVNEDIDESDEDGEEPVFDFKDEDDSDEGGTGSSDDDEDEDTGFAKKIARQKKFMQHKTGGVEDDMHDGSDDEEEGKSVWGRRKNLYYNADNVDYELLSSDEDLPAEEEAEVLRLQREKAKSFSLEDFGLEDVDMVADDSNGKEKTLQDMFSKEKAKGHHAAQLSDEHLVESFEEIKKDLSALTKEEQMDVVYSSAPELVGLLSDLNDALNELEQKIKPVLGKVKERNISTKGGMHFIKVKQLLLLVYCQAIGFYLLLKSEGHPVRDHPVIAHLVEIKNLLEKMKQIDEALPYNIEEIVNQEYHTASAKLVKGSAALELEPQIKNDEAHGTTKVLKACSAKDSGCKDVKQKAQNEEVGLQSLEMLKVRASLEEKMKQKGVYNIIAPKSDRSQKQTVNSVNRQLESLADFDDEVVEKEIVNHGKSNGLPSSSQIYKLSQLVSTKVKKPKVMLASGDDDLPKRDDIGERRRKHELRVLARAGVEPVDEEGDEDEGIGGAETESDDGEGASESEDEFYRAVKKQRTAKMSAKADLYSRTPIIPSFMEMEADGKRKITYQMEKNRGLTRSRKKLTKIPRKKYKLKHQKAVVRRKGQVREIRKPTGPYGGEASGININISRSVRLKG